MSKFVHIEGCQVCHDLYRHYTLPNGQIVHMFVDEPSTAAVHVSALRPFGRPAGLSDLLIDSLPLPPVAATPVLAESWARFVSTLQGGGKGGKGGEGTAGKGERNGKGRATPSDYVAEGPPTLSIPPTVSKAGYPSTPSILSNDDKEGEEGGEGKGKGKGKWNVGGVLGEQWNVHSDVKGAVGRCAAKSAVHKMIFYVAVDKEEEDAEIGAYDDVGICKGRRRRPLTSSEMLDIKLDDTTGMPEWEGQPHPQTQTQTQTQTQGKDKIVPGGGKLTMLLNNGSPLVVHSALASLVSSIQDVKDEGNAGNNTEPNAGRTASLTAVHQEGPLEGQPFLRHYPFNERREFTESKDLLDTAEVLSAAFEKDMRMLCDGEGLSWLVKDANEAFTVKQLLKRKYAQLLCIFRWCVQSCVIHMH